MLMGLCFVGPLASVSCFVVVAAVADVVGVPEAMFSVSVAEGFRGVSGGGLDVAAFEDLVVICTSASSSWFSS